MKSKKLIAILMATILLALLAACTGGEDESNSGNPPANNPGQNVEEPVSSPTEGSTPNSGADSGATANADFDTRFEGVWVSTSEEHRGDVNYPLGLRMYYILHDGRFFVNEKDYLHMITSESAMPRITTSGSLVDIIDMTLATYPESDRSNINVADLNITVTYEFSKGAPLDASRANYFAKYDDNELTLNVIGTYQENAVSVKSIDSTFVYTKNYPWASGPLYQPALEGNWSDNMGNAWTFFYESTADTLFDMKCTMTDTTGTIHAANSISGYWDKDDPECTETTEIRFEGELGILKYTIVSYDGNTLILNDGGSADLILIRNQVQ